MKKVISILFVFFIISGTKAQDLDLYKKTINDKFILPTIPHEMTFQEFKILETNLRMQDMVIAAILPGHIHFKINEKKTGYYLLGTRITGYAGWAYLSLKNQSLLQIVFYDNYTPWNNQTTTGDQIVAYTSAFLIIGSYLYDWIHGKYLLDNKQNKIRYKYARKKAKLNLGSIQIQNKNYPALSFQYTFQ